MEWFIVYVKISFVIMKTGFYYGKNMHKNRDCPGSITEDIYLYRVHEMIYGIHENAHLWPNIRKPCFIMDRHD